MSTPTGAVFRETTAARRSSLRSAHSPSRNNPHSARNRSQRHVLNRFVRYRSRKFALPNRNMHRNLWPGLNRLIRKLRRRRRGNL